MGVCGRRRSEQICCLIGDKQLGWANDAVTELAAGRTVQIQPFGGSMRGRIESGQLVTLEPVGNSQLRVGEIVFVRWKSSYLLHLIVSIADDLVGIGNNLGKFNGEVSHKDVLGFVTKIEDEPTTSATISGHRSGLVFDVCLDDGRQVLAKVRKQTARLMLRIAVGDRVVVAGLWNSKFQIQGFERSPDAG